MPDRRPEHPDEPLSLVRGIGWMIVAAVTVLVMAFFSA